MMSTFCFVPYWMFIGAHAKHNMFRCAVHKWIPTNRCIPAMPVYERVRKLLGGIDLVPNAQWNIPYYDYLVQTMKDSMHGQDVFGLHFARKSLTPLCRLEATIAPWAGAKNYNSVPPETRQKDTKKDAHKTNNQAGIGVSILCCNLDAEAS